MDRFKLVFCNILIASIVFGGLYWIWKTGENERAIKIEAVNRNDRYVKGLITKMFYYKGRSIRVKYTVDNKEYENSGGWSKNPNNVHEGDSIWLRYAIEDPNLFITELENDY
ncbi:hypothetical protein [Sphingobacterium sp. BIGb0116]|uniref:hypothetical protein n=1 Tax=Sphingobacterium sp. BIGb0116 TaxID=2940619 RepID=UPI002167B3ED|nr:hypothetical protein [Sphingobacterium sp. BIGb0116]MCS4165291.1 hypothetical protein [Sphingobacterium sp. BIGb0116]